VAGKFPNAFLSNAQCEALKRSGRRGPRTRPKTEGLRDIKLEMEGLVLSEHAAAAKDMESEDVCEDSAAAEDLESEDECEDSAAAVYLDSELHSSEYSDYMRTDTHAFLHEAEPDEEKFPPMAEAWCDSGFSVAASAGLQSSAAAVCTVARIAVREALKDLSLQDALDVLAEAARETVESSHI
jgi:galactokinase